jgi:ketosteroid isomerase-like protein
MRRTGIGIAVLAVVCAAAFAGCGGGDDNGKDTELGRAAQKYVDAYNARDFDQVCDLLSNSYKAERQLVPGSAAEPEEEGELETGCSQYFKEHTAGAATKLTLLDAQQKGEIGTAHLRSESEDTNGTAEINMGWAREPNGAWQVTDLSPFSEGSS